MKSTFPVYAINCGSKTFEIDFRGTKYQNDTTSNKRSFHQHHLIVGVPAVDQPIYQKHAWVTCGSMRYDVPIVQEGDYILTVMVYNHSNNHNMNILLNGTHKIVENLSVFDKVGKNVAHEEKTRFKVQGNEVIYGDDRSALAKNAVSVTFTGPTNGNVMVSGIVLELDCTDLGTDLGTNSGTDSDTDNDEKKCCKGCGKPNNCNDKNCGGKKCKKCGKKNYDKKNCKKDKDKKCKKCKCERRCCRCDRKGKGRKSSSSSSSSSSSDSDAKCK